MTQGIVLYVDISQLEQLPASVESIYVQMQYLLAQYQAAQQGLSACELSAYFDTYKLRQYGNQFRELTLKVKKLETTLSEIAGIYQSYNARLSPDAAGNLNQEDLPWYKSNECKIAVGVAVIAVAAIAVIVFPVSAIAVGALAGAATGAVLGGVIGGCSSKKAGGSFEDGFADGFLWGSVSGALSGAVGGAAEGIGMAAQNAGYVKHAAGAARTVAAIGDGAVDSAINIGQSVYNGQEVDAGDVALSFVTGALVSYGTSAISTGISKKRLEKAEEKVYSRSDSKTSYGKSSEIIQCNTKDAAADELAKRIGGQSRSAFADDLIQREFDVISDQYIAQAKPPLKCVNKTVRTQMKATFEAAKKYGRKVYYQFEGIPSQEVFDKLYEYSERYGVEVIIDTEPLGVLN